MATHKLTLVPFIEQRIRQLSDNEFHENTTDKMTFFKKTTHKMKLEVRHILTFYVSLGIESKNKIFINICTNHLSRIMYE